MSNFDIFFFGLARFKAPLLSFYKSLETIQYKTMLVCCKALLSFSYRCSSFPSPNNICVIRHKGNQFIETISKHK